MTKRTPWGVVAGAVALGGLVACTSTKVATPPPPTVATSTTRGNGTLTRSELVTVQATVVAVNQKKRLVTLRGPDGDQFTIRVDDSVKNLPQVRKGDDVTASYYSSVAVRLRKPGQGKPGIAAGEDVIAARPGEMPAAAGARIVEITATVTKVDRAKQEVTLRGPRGKSVTVKVKDPANLEKVKNGDLVEVTYTEAVAIAVDKPSR